MENEVMKPAHCMPKKFVRALQIHASSGHNYSVPTVLEVHQKRKKLISTVLSIFEVHQKYTVKN
jgi:hypothetical protein